MTHEVQRYFIQHASVLSRFVTEHPSSFFENLVKLISAIVWPGLIFIGLLIYRRFIGDLFLALTNLAKNADEIKIWQVEVKRDIAKVLDKTAENAAAQPSPSLDIPKPEIQAAQRVSALVSEGPTEAAKEKVVNAVFQQMLSLSRDYESTRASMKPGPNRTSAMNAIVARMRALGPTSKEFLPELTSNKESPGARLAGIAILELSPDENYLNWLAERMAIEQPFVFYHASLALLAAVRFYGASRREVLGPVLQSSLDTLKSFAGIPHASTLDALTAALEELG